MGVKDLWAILSPICERKSLYELQDKAIAVDLSCWVVEDQSLGTFSAQPRMYLRNLFFRTTCLLHLGVKPIFVLEGDAPALKHNTMARRNETQFGRKNTQQSQEPSQTQKPSQTQGSQGDRKKGTRSRLRSLLKQCAEMLRLMGVCCVQSSGEAEALCAQLNAVGAVAGCISQDGDCFLYGATTVYRNFTVSAAGGSHSSGYSVDVYHMADVRGKLGLDRRQLVALSLLCGCDYGEGVAGIGKQTAKAFLDGLGEGEDVLDRLRRWRTDPYFERLERERAVLLTASACDNCCHAGKQARHGAAGCKECGTSAGCDDRLANRVLTHQLPEERKVLIAELNLRKKALLDPDFPSQDTIDEFLAARDLPDTPDLVWSEPNMPKFVKFAVNLLAWTDTYAVEKFLPLATRWQLVHVTSHGARRAFSVTPTEVVRPRVLKGVASYEVKWTENTGMFDWLTLDEGVTEESLLVTVEPQELVRSAYPALAQDYEAAQEAKKKAKKKPSRKKASTKPVESSKQTKISQFLQPSQTLQNTNDITRNIADLELNNPGGCDTELCNPTSRDTVPDNPRGSDAIKVRRKKAAAVPKKPQVTIASLLNNVRVIEAKKVAAARRTPPPPKTNHQPSGKRTNASPRLKVGLKAWKKSKMNSTPKKTKTDALRDLEMSFRNVSLIDYGDDDGDFSDMSAIIDGIVGNGYEDSFEVRNKYRTSLFNSIVEDKENVTPDIEVAEELDNDKDEFDCCDQKYVPLYERLKAQLKA